MAAAAKLRGREYKLLLQPSRLPASAADAASFVWKQIEGIVGDSLGGNAAGPRTRGALTEARTRRVLFRDTAGLLLDRQLYSLRERVEDGGENAGRREITLRLRHPDAFVAAATPLSGTGEGAQTKLEEDISPLEVQAGAGGVVLPARLSMRSRFSLSTRQWLMPRRRLRTMRDVVALFPTLRRNLGDAATNRAKLVDGPTIVETLVEGARVILGSTTSADFTFTIWDIDRTGPDDRARRLSEVSFRYATPRGKVSRAAAQRALALFVAMQAGLPTNTDEASKTALVLPQAHQAS